MNYFLHVNMCPLETKEATYDSKPFEVSGLTPPLMTTRSSQYPYEKTIGSLESPLGLI